MGISRRYHFEGATPEKLAKALGKKADGQKKRVDNKTTRKNRLPKKKG